MASLRLQTRVVFHPGMRSFYDTVECRRLKGAAKLLAKTFWPSYSFARAPKSPGSERGVSARQGRARGARVDREVSLAARGATLVSPHPFTRYALEALRLSEISLVSAQVVVWSGTVATAVDVLGADAAGVLCCIELKCSSDARYDGACGRMRGVLCDRGDSLREQHALQCQVTRLLFERTYARRAHAYVLRVNDRGATLSRLPRDDGASRALECIV